MNGNYQPPIAINEEVLSYASGSTEREALQNELAKLRSKQKEIPMYINGEQIFTEDKRAIFVPHDLKHQLGIYNYGNATHVHQAINAAQSAKSQWERMPWQQRASIFLKAAELVSGEYRNTINAATMLAQSKNAFQAEIDAACEFADFLRFNVQYLYELYNEQPPENSEGIWNRVEYRPLEGFIFAVTPFNFTAISGNLPAAPALMGNTVVWKPADSQIYSAQVVMEIFIKAGLPAGVINLVYVNGPEAGGVIFKHPDFGGLHFTGSTAVFKHLWKVIGNNIDLYKSYPRIVGETGGKDFIMVHPSAEVDEVVANMIRGAFEFQGQKCSAASRCYLPESLWPSIKSKLLQELRSLKMGPTEDFSNFINAVIDQRAFDKITNYIEKAKSDNDAEIISGGSFDKTNGYFIEPTVILTQNPKYTTMCEEIFGPVLTLCLYPDQSFEEYLKILDETSEYALTGAIFSKDRYAIQKALDVLKHSAGNFYINDKPTGAVVGQQPFGGARGSGTNDKAGAKANLTRWVSMRTIKENLKPVGDYRYPFHQS
ncbi:MAG: 1-pyrroline-5-carboxylate dehydrogenase [Bacteroidetes bacterium MED-G17]|nr:MAG: 1-pyrroline-5-carboxylate dehydrogenase [Bacteroidetes bacterium TMED39]PDH53063.1 MAG: 1-pyrroline-5-carboxylate dehydrogenase [Bacteroidetes bacterium MED-G17]|tara:strand:- start:1311 stop:2939 length:1629 start_codon:yes stop_codon:yes gene_type:complete